MVAHVIRLAGEHQEISEHVVAFVPIYMMNNVLRRQREDRLDTLASEPHPLAISVIRGILYGLEVTRLAAMQLASIAPARASDHNGRAAGKATRLDSLTLARRHAGSLQTPPDRYSGHSDQAPNSAAG